MTDERFEIWGDYAEPVYRTGSCDDAVDTYLWLFADDPTFLVAHLFRRVEGGWPLVEFVYPSADVIAPMREYWENADE